MKTYVVKTYNKNWTYKETINPNHILNEITFSRSLNWWLWQLQIQTDYWFNDISYKGWEYVKVWLFDDYHDKEHWKQIYYWFITNIERRAEESREYQVFTCLWVGSLLKNIIYSNGSYSQTCYNMMVNIRNFFNNIYSWIITQGSIANDNTTIQNWNWSWNNCYDCFETIANAIWYNWTVDWEWKLDLFLPNTRAKHIVSFSEEVMTISVKNSIEEMVNNLYLARSWAQSTYSDWTSQNTYWRKDKYIMNTNLNSATTMNQYGNSYIAEYKNPKQTVQLTLNEKYPYEDIKPWDRITILNTDLTTLNNLVINKIQYKTDQCVITIDYEDTLWSVIK